MHEVRHAENLGRRFDTENDRRSKNADACRMRACNMFCVLTSPLASRNGIGSVTQLCSETRSPGTQSDGPLEAHFEQTTTIPVDRCVSLIRFNSPAPG